MATSSLASLLFGTYRRQALGLLLMNPERQFHVRELSRVTGTNPGTMHKELARLAEAGILVRRSSGNQALYGANTACPIFDDLRNILRKTSGVADVLRDALQQVRGGIEVAFVYGSMARGDEGPGSDVDVMVIGDASFVEVAEALQPAQEQLVREINPVKYSPGEFRRKALESGSFLQRVLREKKLFLVGDESDLGKLVEDKASSPARAQRRGTRKAAQVRSTAARRRKV